MDTEVIGGEIKDYPNCFGCGDANLSGLRLVMKTEGELLTAEFMPERRHEGWPGLVHGGVVAAVLYEMMENWPYLNGIVTMIREMVTRLAAPAEVGKTICATSWLDRREGREMSVRARLTSGGRTIAEGTASLVELSEEQRRRIGV